MGRALPDPRLEVEAGQDEVVIRLMGESTFDSGKADIKPELKPMIRRIGQILAMQASGGIIIAGHTDNMPSINSWITMNGTTPR